MAGRPATQRCSTREPASWPRSPAPRRGRTTSSRRTSRTARSRSRSRIAPSTRTARSSTPTRARSSTGSSPTTSRKGRSPRSGIRSSSATRSWSTATPGRSSPSSSGRYRLRFLNGCQSRFLILDFDGIPGVEAWQIGNEGGFLAAPVDLTADHGNRLLMGLAERADVIVDFTNVPVGKLRARERRPRRAVRRRRPRRGLPRCRPGHDRPDHAVRRRPCRSEQTRRRRRSSSSCPPLTPLPRGDADAAAGADREGGRGRRRRGRGGRGADRGSARHGRRTAFPRRSSGWTP